MCTQFLDVYIQGPCKRSNKSIRSSRVLECVGARGAHWQIGHLLRVCLCAEGSGHNGHFV